MCVCVCEPDLEAFEGDVGDLCGTNDRVQTRYAVQVNMCDVYVHMCVCLHLCT